MQIFIWLLKGQHCRANLHQSVSIWRPADRASRLILIIKPTRCTNFSNYIFGIKFYMFRTVPLPIISSSSLYTQQWYISDSASWKILIIKRTRYTNFSNFIFVIKFYMFRTVPLSIIRIFFHCTRSNDICHTGLLTAYEQDQDGTARKLSTNLYDISLLRVQWKKILMMDKGIVRNM